MSYCSCPGMRQAPRVLTAARMQQSPGCSVLGISSMTTTNQSLSCEEEGVDAALCEASMDWSTPSATSSRKPSPMPRTTKTPSAAVRTSRRRTVVLTLAHKSVLWVRRVGVVCTASGRTLTLERQRFRGVAAYPSLPDAKTHLRLDARQRPAAAPNYRGGVRRRSGAI